jgi:hypothetical protein
VAKNVIDWAYFPQSIEPTEMVKNVVKVFEDVAQDIDSHTHAKQDSDVVLGKVAAGLIKLKFSIETGKKKEQKIRVPVLFGKKGLATKSFDADALNSSEHFVIEIEAGRGYTNYQFLKDLFEACMMHDIQYLAIAVRNTYRNHPDFSKVFDFFDTLYKSSRMTLPLKGVLIIGY